jgi:hypothetical protein
MAHVSLDDPQVDSGFEQVSGIGVAEGMNGDPLFLDFSSDLGATEGALDAALSHGQRSVLCSIPVSSKGWEEESRMAVGYPIAAEEVEGRGGERDVAVLGALSPVDMDHHAVGVDIGDFEVETFVKSEAAGVDGGEIGVVLGGFDLGQDAAYFFPAKDSREASFGLGSEDAEDVPVALEDVFVEEAYAAIADAHSIGGPVIHVFSVEEIVLEFLLGD